ncbi:TetR/AcrR family transcriptional regulator [Paenibacillus filicis]|uniref:TetR/AcrR family transcriptional regulator n=1 Tax=Paenibacillus filicis TaxID=669464 RepID=A0ABU9DN58_9BACL
MVRPLEFDNKQALRAAMQTFWTKGYDGASLPDLLLAMDISRSSLYNTYKDKPTLFQQTLTYYQQTIGASKREALTKAPSAKEGIWQYFYRLLEVALSEEFPGGCYFTNIATSLETADEQTRQQIEDSLRSLEQLFYETLRRGQQQGEFDPEQDMRKKAALLLGLSQGLNVLSRVYKDRERFEPMIHAALEDL